MLIQVFFLSVLMSKEYLIYLYICCRSIVSRVLLKNQCYLVRDEQKHISLLLMFSSLHKKKIDFEINQHDWIFLLLAMSQHCNSIGKEKAPSYLKHPCYSCKFMPGTSWTSSRQVFRHSAVSPWIALTYTPAVYLLKFTVFFQSSPLCVYYILHNYFNPHNSFHWTNAHWSCYWKLLPKVV